MTNAGQVTEWLQALDLAQVSITATIDPAGRLGAIGGLWPKLLAAGKEAASLGLLRTVVVAAQQADVAPELLAPDAAPLRIIKAATLHEVLQHLYEEHGPRDAIRRREREQTAVIEVLGRPVPIETHYQLLPLLQEIKRERLPGSGRHALFHHDGEGETETSQGHDSADILRWEEELREERVSYERRPLLEVFSRFRAVVGTAASEVPRFVVLGPPGSGKSTLLQYLAWRAATGMLRVAGRPLLPARVRLRDWEHWGAARAAAEHDLAHFLTVSAPDVHPAPTAAHWRHWLRRGEVLLLLDGLDEIEGSPAFLAALKAALLHSHTCPTLLTCRTVSFEHHRSLCPDFPLFTLAGFEPEQRDAYIRAFPARYPDDYEPDVLIEHLLRTPQMGPLATNPLLLGVLCYVVDDAQSVTLPVTRGALYQKAVERLLTHPRRRLEVRYPGEAPDAHEKLAIIQRAALALFAQGGRQLTFTGDELGHALQQAFADGGYGTAPAPWANALRADLIYNSGLVRGSAEHGFFFLHLTIQEFLAAAALARVINHHGWAARGGVLGDKGTIRQGIDKKLWDPRWQEVMTFLAGQLQDPTPLLTLCAEEKRDDLFRHRLALAAHCVAELPAPLEGRPRAVADRITVAALSRWLRHETRNTAAVVSHLVRALPALARVNRPVDGTPMLYWLGARLRDVNADVRAAMAEALGQIGEPVAHHADVIAALVAALRDADVLTRARAAEALRRVGRAAARHSAVIPALADAARDDAEWFVRFGATRALAAMRDVAMGHPAAREVLTAAAAPGTRERPAALAHSRETGTRDAPPPDAPAVLLAALRHHEAGVRVRATEVLRRRGEGGTLPPEVLPALVEIALHDEDGGVRMRTLGVLGATGDLALQRPEVLSALAAALHDRDDGVRAHAARALGQLPRAIMAHPEVLAVLLETLRDKDSDVRLEAAEALKRVMAQGVRLFRRWWGKTGSRAVGELSGWE